MTDLNKIPELKNIPVDRLIELAKADKEGKCLILTQELGMSMLAGSMAIVNTLGFNGMHCVYNNGAAIISYEDAAINLNESAHKIL